MLTEGLSFLHTKLFHVKLSCTEVCIADLSYTAGQMCSLTNQDLVGIPKSSFQGQWKLAADVGCDKLGL